MPKILAVDNEREAFDMLARDAMHLGARYFVTKSIDFNYLNLAVTIKIIDLVG